ncbi:alpha/beta hydrolase fold domain-containing protein [Flavobacteriaceae bacterium Ap0902]|nr:alpha/beta hydrolase fold domain-containing protein [Flavobacteriaceae bacterium Ap0902]
MISINACSTYKTKIDRHGNKKIYNVAYGNLKPQKMDVFIPKHFNDSSFVILVHGGAWTIGSKSHLRGVQKFLLKNNIASANIDYRLVDGKNITYKEQIEDLNQATHFILDSLENKPQLILLGESSGGHISMLYGYNNPHIVDKIITFAGPADLYSERYRKTKFYKSYTEPTFKKIVGEKNQPFDKAITKLKEASPITQVSNVPTLTFQGTWDMLVNKEQSLALDSVLTEKNIPHELVLIKNANHTPRFMPWWRNQVINPKILEFIHKHPDEIGK